VIDGPNAVRCAPAARSRASRRSGETSSARIAATSASICSIESGATYSSTGIARACAPRTIAEHAEAGDVQGGTDREVGEVEDDRPGEPGSSRDEVAGENSGRGVAHVSSIGRRGGELKPYLYTGNPEE
jgi:hypothetical protein